MPVSVLALCLAALSFVAPHPQDGPDADVRVRLERDALRVDLFVNLAYVDEVVELARAEPALVSESEAPALHAALFEHFARANSVEIDGVAVRPLDEGFGFLAAEPGAEALFPRFGARAAARVRLALAYPVKAPPSELAITWGSFPPDGALSDAADAPPIALRALFDHGAEEQVVAFTAEAPCFVWRAGAETGGSHLFAVPPPRAARKLPGFSALIALSLAITGALCFRTPRGRRFRRAWLLAAPFALAAGATARDAWPIALPGATHLSADEALAVFRPLHANIYRAFDYRGESEVYDALAQSVSGELLDRLYREVHQSLVLQEAGGAVARVLSVTPLETRVESIGSTDAGAPSFTVDARWRVRGVVRHWGHEHERTNEHRARYLVAAGPDGWRIASSEVLEQRRVDPSAERASPPADGAR